MESQSSNAQIPPPFNVRIAMLGAGGVGKTSIVIKFCTLAHVPPDYDPTILDGFKKDVIIEGTKRFTLEFLDTAGGTDEAQFFDASLRVCDGFLLVYAINDRESFLRAQQILENIRARDLAAPPPFPRSIFILGNKCDLPESMRAVRIGEAAEWAAEKRAHLFEVSAKEDLNLETSIFNLALMADLARSSAPQRAGGSWTRCSFQ